MPRNVENLSVPKPALTTDFLGSNRPIDEFVPKMADAGFEEVLWCEKWEGGYKYNHREIRQIIRISSRFGIQVRQVHASEGEYPGQWVSPDDDERQKGLDVIRNRIHMAHDLGAKVVTVHAPRYPMNWTDGPQAYHDNLERSLGELQKQATNEGIIIGLENVETNEKKFDNFPAIEFALGKFGPEYVGITYDSGHGNLMRIGRGDHMGRLDLHRNRIIDTHLHDNSGVGASKSGKFKIQEGANPDDDMHRLMFSGSVDWLKLADIFARSEVSIPLTSEASMKYDPDMDYMVWLNLERNHLETFSRMVAQKKALLRNVQNPVGEVTTNI